MGGEHSLPSHYDTTYLGCAELHLQLTDVSRQHISRHDGTTRGDAPAPHIAAPLIPERPTHHDAARHSIPVPNDYPTPPLTEHYSPTVLINSQPYSPTDHPTPLHSHLPDTPRHALPPHVRTTSRVHTLHHSSARHNTPEQDSAGTLPNIP